MDEWEEGRPLHHPIVGGRFSEGPSKGPISPPSRRCSFDAAELQSRLSNPLAELGWIALPPRMIFTCSAEIGAPQIGQNPS